MRLTFGMPHGGPLASSLSSIPAVCRGPLQVREAPDQGLGQGG